MCLILVFATLLQDSLWNANVRSRLATVQSLVERGTFRIDESEFRDTIDKVQVNGHFYSDKPPLLAVMGAASYYLVRALEGRRGALGKYTAALITASTLGISFVPCVICFYDALRRTGIAQEYRLIMTASLGLATIYGSGISLSIITDLPLPGSSLDSIACYGRARPPTAICGFFCPA